MHQPISPEGVDDAVESTEDGLLFFEDQLAHHHHEVLIERRADAQSLLVPIRHDLLIDLIEYLESFRVDAIPQRILELLPFGDIPAVYIFGLIIIQKRLEGGKYFERLTIDNLRPLIEKILSIPEKGSNMCNLFRDILIFGECLRDLFDEYLNQIQSLAVLLLQQYVKKELIKGQLIVWGL